jgi:hypothetical protein
MKNLSLLISLLAFSAQAQQVSVPSKTWAGSKLSASPSAWNGATKTAISATTSSVLVGGVGLGGTDTTVSTAWAAAAFALTQATEIGEVVVNMKLAGGLTATSTIAAYLYTDSAGVPGTSISDTSTGQPIILHGGDFTTSYKAAHFRLPKTGLSISTVYWVVFKVGASGGNFVFDTAASGGNFYATAADSGGAPGAWTGSAKSVNALIFGASGVAVYGYSPDGYGIEGDGGDTGFGARFFGKGGPGSKSDSVDNYGAGGTTTYGSAGVRGSGVYGFGGQFISDYNAGAQIQTLANGQVGLQCVANDAAALQLVSLTAGGISAQGLDSTFSVKWQIASSGGGTFTSLGLTPAALGTCGASAGNQPEGTTVTVPGATTTPTKKCTCTFTPTGSVYAWVNDLKNNGGTGIGTATTCP